MLIHPTPDKSKLVKIIFSTCPYQEKHFSLPGICFFIPHICFRNFIFELNATYSKLTAESPHHRQIKLVKITFILAHIKKPTSSPPEICFQSFIKVSGIFSFPNRSSLAWFSVDLQEHKSHNNALLVMDHITLGFHEMFAHCKNKAFATLEILSIFTKRCKSYYYPLTLYKCKFVGTALKGERRY